MGICHSLWVSAADLCEGTINKIDIVNCRQIICTFQHFKIPVMKLRILLLFLAFQSITFGLNAQAAISMQGTIRNSSGTAVDDGKYSLTFRIYTAATGGSPVWSETQDNIKVVGGVYSAILGEVNPLNAAFNVPYYVGLSVDGGQELSPRFRLTSAPYALSLIGQSNTFPSSGTVGIGTATPDPNTALTVSGGSDNAKLLVTAPGDKNALIWMRSGNLLSGIQMGASGNFDITAPGALYFSGSRVHLVGGGQIRAYTDEDGFIVNNRLHATSSIYAANAITSGGVLNAVNMFLSSGDLSSTANIDLKLYRGSDQHIRLRGDGWTEFNKAIYAPSHISQYFTNNVRYLDQGGVGLGGSSSNQEISIWAEKRIRAEAFLTASDRRIKKDLRPSSGIADLAKLMQLKVTDYRHIDSLDKGPGVVKGFIAQQVEEVYPEAVNRQISSIPDIFAKPVAVRVNGDAATFSMSAGHSLSTGDRVRIFQDGGDQKEYEVIGTEDSSFTVKDWNSAFNDASKVFVYGKEVNDFRQVDYDKIHTLNVSATQELARQLEQLRAENAELKRANETGTAELNRVLGEMQRTNEIMNGRLAKLEALLEASSSKR